MDTMAKLDLGFVMTILGMGVVFSVLIFLAYTFKLMEIVFRPRKKKETAVTVAEVSSSASETSTEDSSALVAVISAAISSCVGGKTQLVVRSITRVADTMPAWGKMGRQEQMASRLNG